MNQSASYYVLHFTLHLRCNLDQRFLYITLGIFFSFCEHKMTCNVKQRRYSGRSCHILRLVVSLIY